MIEKTNVVELFEKNKSSLLEELNKLSRPLDENVSIIVGDFLRKLISDNRERINLSTGEQKLFEHLPAIISCYTQCYLSKNQELRKPLHTVDNSMSRLTTGKMFFLIASTFVGGLLGGLAFDSWIGSLAISTLFLGVSLFVIGRNSEHNETDETVEENMPDFDNVMVRTQALCKIIDDIVTGYRLQIKKSVDEYQKNQAKPFEEEYLSLLEHIQSLIGYERYKRDDPDYTEELQERCEEIIDILSNEGLSFVDYTEGDASKFELIEIDTITTTVKVYPAIVKDGWIVMNGRVFVPKK